MSQIESKDKRQKYVSVIVRLNSDEAAKFPALKAKWDKERSRPQTNAEVMRRLLMTTYETVFGREG